jgi:hypothetical protein
MEAEVAGLVSSMEARRESLVWYGGWSSMEAWAEYRV